MLNKITGFVNLCYLRPSDACLAFAADRERKVEILSV
jgi:hypothetical protein